MASDETEPNKVSIKSNGGSRPVPDPTSLTTEALRREIDQLKELLETKLDRLSTKMTGHFLIDDQRFGATDERFKIIETQRIEQKRDTQDAVDAALTAQKELVAKQDEFNQKAITKSELATADTLSKLQELFKTTTDALRDKIDDVKTVANGTVQQKVGAREDRTGLYAALAAIAGVIVLAIAIVGFIVATAARATV